MLRHESTGSSVEVDADAVFDVEEYERCTADTRYNLKLLQEWIDREANSYAHRVKRLMTEEEFAQVLIRVSRATTPKELGEIRHESPGWELMTEKMCSEFSRAVDARRIFLDDERRLRSEEMSPYDRAQYIALHCRDTDPYAQDLVRIARAVQARVTEFMTIEEIYRKPDFLAGYRSTKKKVPEPESDITADILTSKLKI